VLITGCQTSQTGTNLIELMIGSALGLIILSALAAFYADTARQTGNGLEQARLNHDIHTVLYIITRDLRRAGYRATQPGVMKVSDNPFDTPENALRVGEYRGEKTDSCITFSYDLNNDHQMGVGSIRVTGTPYSNSNQERFGFRLRQGRVQMRTGGKQFDCNSGSWQSVTEPALTITLLRFTLTEDCLHLPGRGSACIPSTHPRVVRKVNVQLEGHLAKNPRIAAALTESVHIRNHLHHPAHH